METTTQTCSVCLQTYLADPGRLKHGRQTTCSRVCSYRLRAAAKSKGQAFLCAICGKAVRKTPSQMKSKYGSVFCSRACHYAGRSTGATCRVVCRPYVYTPEGKAAMIEASKRPKGQRRFHPTVCTHCRNTFDDPSDGRARKSGLPFCSLACCNAYRKGPNNPAWRGGHPKYYGPDWRAARREAWARDKQTCRRCGGRTKRRPDVHHIQPVSSFANPNDAHFAANLVCLCHRCHMLAEWHGIDFPV